MGVLQTSYRVGMATHGGHGLDHLVCLARHDPHLRTPCDAVCAVTK